MAAWTAMNNLSVGDLVTEEDMDAIRGNIEYLLDPNKDAIDHNEGSNYSTTSTSFVDVDATNLSISITTNGGPVLAGVTCVVTNSSTGNRTRLTLDVDGTAQGSATSGIIDIEESGGAAVSNGSFTYLLTGLSAGSHTIKLQFAVDGGTGTISSISRNVGFWAIEL